MQGAQTRARTGSVSSSSGSSVSSGLGATRARSKTGLGASGQLLPKPSFPSLMRKNSVVSVAETAGQRVEYLFCVAGDVEGVTGFLRLFFENDSLFAACNFVRNFPRFKQPEDTVRVSFCPLVGYGNGMWFDDEVLRKSEGVIFVHHVQRDLTAEFLHWRKRIGNARAESKVLLVAFDDCPESIEVGSVEAAAKEVRVHAIKTLAGSYACLYKEVGSSRAKTMIEGMAAVSVLLDELIGKVNVEGEQSVRTASRSAEIAFVGSMFTGKTALVNRLANGQRVLQYTHTTMMNTQSMVHVAEDLEWKLKLIDTSSICAPADVDGALPREVATKLSGCVLVFSVRDAGSFRLLGQLPSLLQRASGKKLPMLVVATNVDETVMRSVSREEASAFCDAAQMQYVEVSCLDDTTNVANVLGPLLKRMGETEKIVHVGADGSEAGQLPSEAVANTAGVLFARELAPAGKKPEWIKMQAEMKRDLLVLSPVVEEEKIATPPPQIKDERRFSGLLTSIRRRSILKSKDGSPSSNSSSPVQAEVSPRTSRVRLPPEQSDQVRTVLLADAVISVVPMNVDTNRFPFSVEDLSGKVHSFEVLEGEKRRDEWVTVLRAASKKFSYNDGGSSPSMISSNTLGRKRGKTFNVLARATSSARLFE